MARRDGYGLRFDALTVRRGRTVVNQDPGLFANRAMLWPTDESHLQGIPNHFGTVTSAWIRLSAS
jgi:hypothetical protein